MNEDKKLASFFGNGTNVVSSGNEKKQAWDDPQGKIAGLYKALSREGILDTSTLTSLDIAHLSTMIGREPIEEKRVAALDALLKIARGLGNNNTEMKSEMSDLKQRTVTDKLTQIGNRQKFDIDLEGLLKGRREDDSGSKILVIIDGDYFKKVNDTYGHVVGDIALQSIAKRLNKAARSDSCYRYGGEEFAVILEDSKALERFMSEISNPILFKVSENEFKILTVSAGATVINKEESAEENINRADRNLYRAKEAGRNRICFDDGKIEVVNPNPENKVVQNKNFTQEFVR